ncbi:protein PHYTOCHROME-DEPENDENT LATE-FLOWERING-like [Aristolochia californica]|uniref:protein PHYTOCHROME-DEPENDENT LATE-FLOWERING-like n=1 Tax=Aristolochia californica TaxID=171875 RepID=UPI0035E0E183
MGVSFKVSKTGTRYRSKLSQPLEICTSDNPAISDQKSAGPAHNEVNIGLGDDHVDHVGYSTSLVNYGREQVVPEPEVSFSLILFPEGFAIGKPNEKGLLAHLFQDSQRLFHPYNRESKTLFSAIENGWLPGDIFDDLPCKYLNGTITCEVQDYRNFAPEPGNPVPMGNGHPIIQKVHLQMCTENVVKDMASISDDSWTYGDLLEVESRIIKALQPELCLDPNPSFERLCKSPILEKLNLGIYARHKRSQRHVKPVKIITDNHLQKNYDMEPEAARRASLVECQMELQRPANCSRSFPATAESPPNLARGIKHVVTDSCSDPRYPDVALGKRERCEVQSLSLPMLKKPKQEMMDHEYRQFTGNQVGSHLGTDLQRRGSLLELHLEAQKMQPVKSSGQKHNKVAMNHFTPSPQRNSGSHNCEKDLGTGDASTPSHKRKPSQNPRLSAGLPGSALVSNTEKASSSTSGNSGNNGSLIQETQGLTKVKANSLPNASSTSGAGSPLSASNFNAPLGGDASSAVSQQKLPLSGFKGDPAVLNKFMMIDMVVKKYNLNHGSKKPDRYLDRKPLQHSPHQLMRHLSQDIKEFKDPAMPMSKSLVGGSTEIGKIRTLMFERVTRSFQGTGMHIIVRKAFCKLLLSNKPKDHNVEACVLYGDEDSSNSSGFSRLFPDTCYADLFAAQFAALMLRDGYQLTNDHLQPFQYCSPQTSDSIIAGHLNALPAMGAVELPYTSSSCGQNLNLGMPVSSATMNQLLPSPNILSRPQTLFNANLPVSPLQLGYLAQPPQMDSASLARSLPLVTNNTTGSTNLLVGNQMISNDSLYQFRLRQQCQRQNIQHQHQGKMMVGGTGPTIGMGSTSGGSTGSSGSPGMGNMVGMGSFRGGLSSPLSLTSLNQIANISQVSGFGLNPQIRSGGIFQTQAAALAKMRFNQNQGRGMISGGSIRCPMETIGGMMVSGSMPAGSMMNQQAMSGTTVQAAATATALMRPRKLSTMNHMLNQQQLWQHQLEQQQALQQRIGSAMQHSQASGLPDQMDSPVSHISSQQMSHQGPMSPQQLSLEVGPVNSQQISQHMTAGNIGLGPGSPQLSSQTHGSVGSITNSPMELQGVSKGGSVNNTSAGE